MYGVVTGEVDEHGQPAEDTVDVALAGGVPTAVTWHCVLDRSAPLFRALGHARRWNRRGAALSAVSSMAAERVASVAEDWRDRSYRKLVQPLLSDAAYAADPRARAALRLLIADAEERPRAKLLLAQVGGNAALPAADPLRVGALVRLASLEHADALAREAVADDRVAVAMGGDGIVGRVAGTVADGTRW